MNKFTYLLTCMFLICLIGGVSAEVNEYAPVKQNDCVLIKQICASCSYVNVSVSYPNSTLAISNDDMTNQGAGVWTYNFCNTSSLGRYDVNGQGDINGVDTGFDVLWFEVTSSGELTNSNQGYMVLGQLGIIGLLLVIGLSFDKAKWKLRTAFFMFSLLLGAITLNSIRIISGSSSSLNSMGNIGLILGVIILSFMFLFMLINYTIELFLYFREKRKMKWEVNEQV